ncbi:putative mitochondrial protein [Sesamum angolense]|uniref:Mitochondrial protein n=1 Tax=Sesamum angolense TaxID=2727404 RepID=A0AAE2BLF1_9LAMI|nr:putative mitochondrial protein [Sesamum angolense]
MVVNLEKSEIAFSGYIPKRQNEDLALLEVRVVEKYDKYLGLPTLVGRSKKEIFQSLKDRIWKRLQSWRCKNLSQVGKVVLLQSVLQAMPTYVRGCFLIPVTMCRELEGLIADFLWHNMDVMMVHWLSWNKLCMGKNEGRLGVRKLGAFNKAMLAKQFWQIIINPASLLSRILKQKYFPHSSGFSVEAGQGSSYTWRSILTARALIIAGTRWQAGEWKEGLIQAVFRNEDVEVILGITEDIARLHQLSWHYEKSGRYTVTIAYRLFNQGLVMCAAGGGMGSTSYKLANWKFIWKTKVPPKVRIEDWRTRTCFIVSYAVTSLASSGQLQTSAGYIPLVTILILRHGSGLFEKLALSASAIIEQVRSWEKALAQKHDNLNSLVSSRMDVGGSHSNPTGFRL